MFGLNMISLIAVAVAVSSLVGLVVVYDVRGTAIERLETQVTSLKKDLNIEKSNVALRDKTLDEINLQLAEGNADLNKLCPLWSKIHEETSSDDPVGSVLDGVQ